MMREQEETGKVPAPVKGTDETQAAAEGKQKESDVWAKLDITQLRFAARDMSKDMKHRDVQIAALERNIEQLKAALMMQNTTVQQIQKLDQDSIEIGAQATGRIKVYGTAGKKAEFAKKIKDQLDLLDATKKRMEKLNGAE